MAYVTYDEMHQLVDVLKHNKEEYETTKRQIEQAFMDTCKAIQERDKVIMDLSKRILELEKSSAELIMMIGSKDETGKIPS